MERKTREHTLQISGIKDRITFLAILALLGGPDIAQTFIPGLGSNNEAITRLEGEIKAVKVSIDNIHDDFHHELNILDAKIDETRSECIGYRDNDRNEMESLRHKVSRLELLINQCLKRTQ